MRGPHTQSLDFGNAGGDRGGVGETVQHDVAACLSQSFGSGEADAAQ